MFPKIGFLDFCGFQTLWMDSYVTKSISVFTIRPALKGFFVIHQLAFFSCHSGPLCDAWQLGGVQIWEAAPSNLLRAPKRYLCRTLGSYQFPLAAIATHNPFFPAALFARLVN